MRQAGRYLPEYRAVRERMALLDIVHRPDVCAEVTLQPVHRLGVDAAILFSDITVLFEALGVEFELQDGRGPVVAHPIRDGVAVERLDIEHAGERLPFVLETIRLVTRAQARVPLIGFAGGPFTLASYLVDGAPTRTFAGTKRLMHRDASLWAELMGRLVHAAGAFLEAQVQAGAGAIQVFDSWVGELSPEDFDEFVAPFVRALFERVGRLGVPTIYFGVGTAGLLGRMSAVGAHVIGVDWRIRLDEAWDRIGHAVAIQGNLDPAVLRGPWELVRRRADGILRAAGGRVGHIFNLGHGVLPDTEPDMVRRLVDHVHDATRA